MRFGLDFWVQLFEGFSVLFVLFNVFVLLAAYPKFAAWWLSGFEGIQWLIPTLGGVMRDGGRRLRRRIPDVANWLLWELIWVGKEFNRGRTERKRELVHDLSRAFAPKQMSKGMV